MNITHFNKFHLYVESILRAFSDKEGCDTTGDNHKSICNDGDCPEVIETEFCQSSRAKRTLMERNFTINNCEYNYYAEYTCRGNK